MSSEPVQIESGIPFPGTVGRTATYPWKDLLVGQSFFTTVNLKSMTSTRVNAERTTGFKFIGRTVPGGCRIWRVK